MFSKAKNNAIVFVAGSSDFAARYIYAPRRKGKKVVHTTFDSDTEFAVTGSGEMTALQEATHTMAQYAVAYSKGEWANGHMAIIAPRNVAIRMHAVRGFLKNGGDPAEAGAEMAARVEGYYKMSKAHQETITAFAEAMVFFLDDENDVSLREYDAFNLRHWRLEVDEDVELEEGEELEFVQDEDGNIVAKDGAVVLETNGASYVGKHKVLRVEDGRSASGEPKMVWAIARTGESQRLVNCQKLWNRTLALFAQEDDVDSIEDIDESAAEQPVEEDVDDIEDEAMG